MSTASIAGIVAPSASGKRRGRGVSIKKSIDIIEGRVIAMDLRKRGFTYREIANALTKVTYPKGSEQRVSIRTAFEYVQAELIALRQQTEMDTQSVRDLELERCDAMLAGLWPGIKKGEPGSVMAGIRVMERRSKLLGLDAPTKSEWVGALMTITPEQASKMSDDDIKDRVNQLMNRVTVESAASRNVIEAEHRPA